ncbi:MAG: hypothetical protein ACRBBZ_02145 [Nitrosopumilus sp.]
MASEDNLKFSGKEIEYHLIKAIERENRNPSFFKTIEKRRSIRSYPGRKVEKSEIQKILKA